MAHTAVPLADAQSDVYSQAGEDGVIAAILDALPDKDGWCVEFGAWDGQHLSNSRNLIENRDYAAVLIEGDQERSEDLKQAYADNDRIHPVNAFVGITQEDGLDSILATTPIPENFDFLSIDIDGNDYHVWKAVKQYRPKVVCIEYNPTIPNEVDFVQPADPNITQGSSAAAMARLGEEKGYKLVCALRLNAFFVDAKYFNLLEINDNSLHALRTDLGAVTWIFSGYDGHIFLRGACRLPWHGIRMDESKVQHLPNDMQRFPGGYSTADNAWLKARRLFSFARFKRWFGRS